jgi:hypothetical protein
MTTLYTVLFIYLIIALLAFVWIPHFNLHVPFTRIAEVNAVLTHTVATPLLAIFWLPAGAFWLMLAIGFQVDWYKDEEYYQYRSWK